MTQTHVTTRPAKTEVDDLRFSFSREAQAEITRYIRGPAAGVPVEQLRVERALYPTFHEEGREILARLERPPGAVLVSPVLGLAGTEVRTLTWIAASVLGTPLVQNAEGMRLVDVFDRDRTKRMAQGARYHQTREGGSIHTDNVNIPDEWHYLVFSCVRPAMVGGETILVDASVVHDYLRTHVPEALAELRGDFWFEYRGISDRLYQAPVVHVDERGRAQFRYLRPYLESAHEKAGEPLTERQAWALDVLDSVLDLSENQLRFPLAAGEIIMTRDSQLLHGRTCFADYYDSLPLTEGSVEGGAPIRRTMCRLWIKST
jgi:hypothetical protein